MLTRAQFLGAVLALGSTAVASPVLAQTDQQEVISGARKTLADLRKDPAFGNAARLLKQAYAVMIVPKLLKGGFIVGGEGGQGVILVRNSGHWSDPAFYAIGAASLGLQAGFQQSEMILLVMTKKGVDGLLRDEFKIGAQAGVTIATLGSGVEGALGGATPPDIVVWSSSTGLYGGLTIDGSIIRPQPDSDARFYGRKVTSRGLLYGKGESPRGAELRRDIAAFG